MPLETEIRAPRRVVPRYFPERPFPAYRFVPGVHPHPRRDPSGHSYSLAQPTAPRQWQPEQWRSASDWLFGVDLFNAFFFWEAHESWEGPWSALPRQEAPAILLQGLIQVSASLLKVHMGSLDGALRLSAQGLDKLFRVAERTPRLLGLNLVQTGADFQRYFRPLSRRALPPLDASVPILWLSDEPDA